MSEWLYTILPVLVLLAISGNSYALEWRDLWQSSNQQAEQAFQQQRYDQAAEQFTKPEWKAAAEYKSENYQQVLETLSNGKTSDALYNKGNAYARLGQFEDAKKAYEQALDLNPDNTDAEYNKQLVEEQMNKQKQQQDQQQGKDDSSQEKQNNDDSQEQDQQNKQGEQQQQDGNQEKDQNGQEQKSGSEKESDKQNAGDDGQGNQGQHQEGKEKEGEQAKGSGQTRGEQQQQEQDKSAENVASAEELSKEEEQQANEQWLKRIPDDPGGLLRRKFKYQYKQRQRVPGRQDEQW